MLADSIPGAVEVTGSQDIDDKERRLIDFAEGRARVLVSKPSICGFGLNWQHCARMSFVGVTDSWESYFQAVRRCWRFGQERPVEVHIYASEAEGAVIRNLERKAKDAEAMGAQLSSETAAVIRAEVRGQSAQTLGTNQTFTFPNWLRTREDA
jgi:SNF2 family DNA or RNA helicase